MNSFQSYSDATRLRRLLSSFSMALRKAPDALRPDVPRFTSYDALRLSDGRVLGRKKVILMSGGCSVPTCTMCPFTNENNYGLRTDPQTLLDQVARVLTRTTDEPTYQVLALYNDGSFFAPREVPSAVRLEIAKRVSVAGVNRLIVESLPQFITPKTILPFVEALNGVDLEIGIGLQSSNDLVRETLVNTRVSRPSFESAITVMLKFGVYPKIYLMIKPPFLTDGEAITDVVQSVDYLNSLGVKGATLCPTRVSRNTVAWSLWQHGHYQPPNLWTVVETIRRVHEATAVRVACINLRGTDFESVFPDSCPACADRVVNSLVLFSETGDIADLPQECSCQPIVDPEPLDSPTIVSRSLRILDTYDHPGARA